MNQVTYTVTIEQEDCSLEGNVLMSGDDAADRAAEDEIRERLYRGDDSAWCTVKVTARFGDFSGSDYLGCVTLTDDYTAEQCARDHGMHESALEALKLELARAVQSGEAAATLLARLS